MTSLYENTGKLAFFNVQFCKFDYIVSFRIYNLTSRLQVSEDAKKKNKQFSKTTKYVCSKECQCGIKKNVSFQIEVDKGKKK